MPHQCTNCGHVFDDGSKEMLSGCPDCGGNKFQYHPGDVPEEPEEADPPEAEGGAVTDAVGRAANRVRDVVTSEQADARNDVPPETEGVGAGTVDDSADATTTGDSSGRAGTNPQSDASQASSGDAASPPETEGLSDDGETVPAESSTSAEDSAQASARSDVVDQNSLPDPPRDGRVVKEPDDPDDRPDIDSLREELNDQFESIRIVAPGQYELNLMELYDRQEYIIALQENGRYVIEVPDAWDAPESPDDG
jgi:predicted  nucleic acid-binding Zn-ribbon protein